MKSRAAALVFLAVVAACGSSDFGEELANRAGASTTTAPTTSAPVSVTSSTVDASTTTSMTATSTTAVGRPGVADPSVADLVIAVLRSEREAGLNDALAAINEANRPDEAIVASRRVSAAYAAHHDTLQGVAVPPSQVVFHGALVENVDGFAQWFGDFADALERGDGAEQQRLNGQLASLTTDEIAVGVMRTEAMLAALIGAQGRLAVYLAESLGVASDHLDVVQARFADMNAALAAGDLGAATTELSVMLDRLVVTRDELDALMPPRQAARLHQARLSGLSATTAALETLLAAFADQDLAAVQEALAEASAVALGSGLAVNAMETELVIEALGG